MVAVVVVDDPIILVAADARAAAYEVGIRGSSTVPLSSKKFNDSLATSLLTQSN